jgi:hypothetical protein
VKAAEEAGTCFVYLHGAWDTAAPDGEVVLRLDIRCGRPVSGVQAVISFDPKQARLMGETPAAWFAQGSGVESLGPLGSKGRFRYGVVRSVPRDRGVVGEGTAFEIKFRVTGQGDPAFVLEDAVVAAPDGSALPVRLTTGVAGSGEAPVFLRGDANAADGTMNLADGIYILQYLFVNGPAVPCPDAADANDDETVNLADAIYILQHLFAGGPPIAPPHPACGTDTTPHPVPGSPALPACTYDPDLCDQ